jgi:hypothetical protein
VKGRVKDTNLDTYTPLRMGDVPEMDIEHLANAAVCPADNKVGSGGWKPAPQPCQLWVGCSMFVPSGAVK